MEGGCPKATHSHLLAPMCLARPQPHGAQMRAGHWAWEAKSPRPLSEVGAGPSWPQDGMQAQPAAPAAIWFPSARPSEAQLQRLPGLATSSALAARGDGTRTPASSPPLLTVHTDVATPCLSTATASTDQTQHR